MALRPQNPKSRSDQLAERKAAEQDVFFREVDEAVRQDQMSNFMKRYGVPLGALVLVGLLGFGGYLWWDHSHKAAIGLHGEEFTKAIDQLQAGNTDAAKKQLDLVAKDAPDGSGASAKLMLAGMALEKGQREDAVKGFAAIAADETAPKPLRDLATIREMTANFDYVPPQQVIDRLKPLATPGNPWFGSAGEMVGMAYLKQGKRDLAGPLFAAISRDKDSPESLRRRARQLAGLLGVDAIDDVAQAAAGDMPAAAVEASPVPAPAPQ